MQVCRYNTYIAHYKEAECFRIALEGVLYKAGVDMIFAGAMCMYSHVPPLRLLAGPAMLIRQ